MNVLSIIDKIYESSHFGTFLAVSIILLIILFCIVFILGIRDNKKNKNKKENIEEEVKDITFDMPSELDNIKEDVTFEMPSLTQNLENFKKNLEEEIQKEEMAEVRKTSGLILPKEKKTIKVLDLEKIEDTSIIPINDEIEEIKKEVSFGPSDGVNDAIDEFLNEKESKKNVLEEKIFNKNKDLEIPILKEGLSTISSKIEIPIVKEKDIPKLAVKKIEENKNILPIENKKIEQKTIIVSGIGERKISKKEDNVQEDVIVQNNIENKVVNQKKEEKIEQSGMYSSEDDF